MFSGFAGGKAGAGAGGGGFVRLFPGRRGRANISGPYATLKQPFRQPITADFQPLLYLIIFSRPPPLQKGRAVKMECLTAFP